MRVAEAVEMDAPTERELRTLSKGRRVEARVQQRARIVLLAAQGWQNKEIADEVKLDRRQVALWRKRFIDGGVQALLQDAPRWGRPPSVGAAVESFILRTTLHEPPPEAENWSTRTLAAHLGLSATTVRRVWQRNGIKPHVHDIFAATSAAPRFECQRVDVVGLYVSPRERAFVLGCDEIGAPARQRSVPARALAWERPGAAPMREEVLQGSATLLRALKALEGAVAPLPPDVPRHQRWLAFLRLIEREVPGHLQLHLVVDGAVTYGHAEVRAWLARHPRMLLHMPATDAAWPKRIKRILHGLAEHPIGRDSFTSLPALVQAVAQHVERQRPSPRPFVWTAGPPTRARR